MLLVVSFDPVAKLPPVDCEPPKPAAHTLHRCWNEAGGALLNIANASVFRRGIGVGGVLLGITRRARRRTGFAAAAGMNGSVITPMNWLIALNVVCCKPVASSPEACVSPAAFSVP